MSSQKIILAIVEGQSDRDSLETIFNELTKRNPNVVFAITSGDVLQRPDVNSKNVLSKIKDVVEDYITRYKYYKSDILRVIHLVDIDGAFLNKDKIIHKETEYIEYQEEGIYTEDVDYIANRNEKKKLLLKFISTKQKVWKTIPYNVFFFSCNLEWVLHDSKEYYTLEEKCDLAIDFTERYQDDLDGFIEFINSDDIAAPGDYKKSWEYIESVNNGIVRKSNLHLFVNEVSE